MLPAEGASLDRTELDSIRALLRQSRFAEAEAGARRVLGLKGASLGQDAPETAEVIDLLVEALWRGGKAKDPEALALAERAVAIKESSLGATHPGLAASLFNLGTLLWRIGDTAAARSHYDRALTILRTSLGSQHPDVARAYKNLALLLEASGDRRGAKSAFENALSILEKSTSPEKSGKPYAAELASTLDNLATLLADGGDDEGARQYLERSVAVWKKGFGPEDPRVSRSLTNLANLVWNMGDDFGAKRLYEEALAIHEKAFGHDHPGSVRILTGLASVRWKRGDHAGARPLFERAIAIQIKAHGPDHPEVASSLLTLAILLRNTGDDVGATPLLRRAVAILEKAPGADQLNLAIGIAGLANILRRTGDRAEARPLTERALAIREKLLGAEHLLVAESLVDLGVLLRDDGEHAAARDRLQRALDIRRGQLPSGDPLVAEAERQLASLEPLLNTAEKPPISPAQPGQSGPAAPPVPVRAAAAEIWYDHYQKGEEALRSRAWKDAIDRMSRALAEKPASGLQVPTPDMIVINYLPHLKMGIAYFNLGRYDDALREMDAEERLGAIARSPTDLKNLRTFRWLARQELQTTPAPPAAAPAPEESILAIVSRALSTLRPVAVQKIVPAVIIANAANATHAPDAPPQAPGREERVSSADFLLSGLVVDDQAELKVKFVREEVTADGSIVGQQVSAEKPLSGQRMGDIYRYDFAQPFTLVRGATMLRVIVSDPDGLSAEAAHLVRYVRPWSRTPWPYLSSLAILGATAFGVRGAIQLRRRRRLMKRRFNPYVAGAPVLADDLFFGREALLSRILETIHNNSILLYGERRIGKTSLQHHLMKRLQQIEDPGHQFYPVYIDLQGTSQERFFSTLGAEMFNQLSNHLDGARPGAALPPGAPYDDEAFIQDLHAVIKSLRKRGSKKVKIVLLMDEIDELNGYDPRVNQRFRSLFMKSFAENLVAVVSGVGIVRDWSSLGSPWYNFFEEIEVKPFTTEDAEALIRRPIEGVFQLEDGVVGRILERSQGRPYLIQKTCILLVTRMHEERRRRITVADVEAVAQLARA